MQGIGGIESTGFIFSDWIDDDDKHLNKGTFNDCNVIVGLRKFLLIVNICECFADGLKTFANTLVSGQLRTTRHSKTNRQKWQEKNRIVTYLHLTN